jgi:hypothetical protein
MSQTHGSLPTILDASSLLSMHSHHQQIHKGRQKNSFTSYIWKNLQGNDWWLSGCSPAAFPELFLIYLSVGRLRNWKIGTRQVWRRRSAWASKNTSRWLYSSIRMSFLRIHQITAFFSFDKQLALNRTPIRPFFFVVILSTSLCMNLSARVFFLVFTVDSYVCGCQTNYSSDV